MSEVRVQATAPSFFELYSSGDASQDDLDDYVGRWHDEYKDRSEYPPLHEYLGLTRDEYEVLLYDPFSLPCILQARKPGENLMDIMAERYQQLRASNRREDGTIIFSLGNWLERQPRH
jgi:hypothetical protein